MPGLSPTSPRVAVTIQLELDGSYGYSGRYEIDAKHNVLVHLPEVSTGPDFVATRQVRPYRFEDHRMTFSDTVEDGSDVASRKIVWEKVS